VKPDASNVLEVIEGDARAMRLAETRRVEYREVVDQLRSLVARTRWHDRAKLG
jgi:hypothetical protein